MWPSSSTCHTDASEAILFSEIKKGAHLGPLFDSRVSFRKVAQLAEIRGTPAKFAGHLE
jgi:hypothetical protein